MFREHKVVYFAKAKTFNNKKNCTLSWRKYDETVGGGGSAEEKFSVPDWGDKVAFGIGLWHRPARLVHWMAGRYDNPMP